MIFRVHAPIYFANVEYVKDKLRKYEDYHVGRSFSWLHHHCDSEEERDTESADRSPTQQMLIAGQAAVQADQALAEMSLGSHTFIAQKDTGHTRNSNNSNNRNVGVVRTWIDQEGHPDRVRFLVLDLTPVTSIDSSAVHALNDIMAEYKERGIQMVFSNPNSDVLSMMRTTRLIDEHNEDCRVFVHTADAVRSCVLAMKEEDIRAANQIREEKAKAASTPEQPAEP